MILDSFMKFCAALLLIGSAAHGAEKHKITGFSMGCGHMVRTENYSFYLRLDAKSGKVLFDANCWQGDKEIRFENREVDRSVWDAFLKLAEQHNLRNAPKPPKPDLTLDIRDDTSYGMELCFADKTKKEIAPSEKTREIFKAFMKKIANKNPLT